ncbi:hypothetical protein [Janibacter sp. HTCC2649]|uniref:hypothetical protein n=1 Tax=Janibacter sp. HTCC2649 TaxID=313589 RepID=UPI000321351C|nr:hypothetical protein [Janibacter sp. HTCC2649]
MGRSKNSAALIAAVVAVLTGSVAWSARTTAESIPGQQPSPPTTVLSDGAEMLQACVDGEIQRAGKGAVVSSSGWTVVEARQLEGVRARKNIGTGADPRPVLTPAQPLYLVAGYTTDGESTAVCVMGGGPETGYGMLWASLGPTGIPAGHAVAPVSASGVMGAEYDSVVYGWYAAGVTDISATIGGRAQTVASRNGFWSATVLNPEDPSPRSIPELKTPPTIEVSAKTTSGSVTRSTRFATEMAKDKPCWVSTPTADSKCGLALPIG